MKEFETIGAEARLYGISPGEAPEMIGEIRSAIAKMKREIKAQLKAEKDAAKSEPADEAEASLQELQEEEEDSVSVKPFSHNGVQYGKSSSGVVYLLSTHEEVGVWNEETQTITPIEDDESEDEEEDEESEDEEEDEESEDEEEEDDVVCA